MEFSLLSRASYHQAADCLPAEARGRQCVTCCAMFLVTVRYIKPVTEIQRDDLNDILHTGSHLYRAMRHVQLLESDFVNPEHIPNRVHYRNHNANIVHKQVISGLVGLENTDSDENRHSLYFALVKSCTRRENYFVLVLADVAVGIYHDGSAFFLFDSHSRSETGMSCADGTAILAILQSAEGLCSFLEA